MGLSASAYSASGDYSIVVPRPPLCIIAKFDTTATDVCASDRGKSLAVETCRMRIMTVDSSRADALPGEWATESNDELLEADSEMVYAFAYTSSLR